VPIQGVMIVNERTGKEKTALLVRIDAEVHRRAKKTARDQETSLARFVERAIARELHYEPPGKIVATAIRNPTTGGPRSISAP
jgi:HicB family